jgi:hypothetical protein
MELTRKEDAIQALLQVQNHPKQKMVMFQILKKLERKKLINMEDCWEVSFFENLERKKEEVFF